MNDGKSGDGDLLYLLHTYNGMGESTVRGYIVNTH
jgi:hypothetical protein